MLTGQSGYLSNGWDNTSDWQLDYDFKIDGNAGGVFILTTPDHFIRDTDGNTVQIETYTNTISYYIGSSYRRFSGQQISANTWYHLTCIKEGTQLTITCNGVTTTFDFSPLSNYNMISTGVDGWSSVANLKNIKVKSL